MVPLQCKRGLSTSKEKPNTTKELLELTIV